MGSTLKAIAFVCALSISMLNRAHAQAPAATEQEGASDAATGFVVDLNTATASELEQLPGIGHSRALAILEFRQKHGGFTQVSQLMRIKGIGRAMLRKLRPHVTVGPVPPTRAAAGQKGRDPVP